MGAFGYRNWLGVNAAARSDTRHPAAALTGYRDRTGAAGGASVIVAGWAMDNIKPRDFTLSREPLIADDGTLFRIQAMVAAGELGAGALRNALKPVAGKGTALDALREEFFRRTQGPFETLCRQDGRAGDWLAALQIFDDGALPGLAAARILDVETILKERGYLVALFAGRGKPGARLYGELNLPVPAEAA